MLDKALADRYAAALFAAARRQGMAEALGQELVSIRDAIDGTPQLRRVLYHPAISAAEKRAIAEQILSSRVSALALRFLIVLFDAKRIQYLGLIAESFGMLQRQATGRLSVRAVSARPIAEEALRRVGRVLAARTGKNVEVSGEVDERLLGGVRLVFEDHNVIDGSVAHRLEVLRELIAGG